MHFDGLIFFFRLYYWHLLPLLWLNLNEMWPEPLNKKNPKRKQAKGAKNGKTDKRKPRSLGHVNVITLKFMCICNMATCNMWSAWKLFFSRFDCRMFVCDSFGGAPFNILLPGQYKSSAHTLSNARPYQLKDARC